MYVHDTTGEELSRRALQNRLGASFPRHAPPAGWEIVTPPEPTLDELKQRKRNEINGALSAALRDGMSYSMPDGTEEVVQTRPSDEPNLIGLAVEARDLRAGGETNPVMMLRVQSNANHQLTPQQMIDITNAASAFKKQQLAHSWALKDQIDAATTPEDLDLIQW